MKLKSYEKIYHPKIKTLYRFALPWISLSILFCLPSCVGPRYTISPDVRFYPPVRELADSLDYFKAFGDIELLVDGEYNRAKIATRITDSELQTEIYSIFGGTVARMHAVAESVYIDVGERSYTIGRDQGFEQIAFLRKYPFTFNQFARIITGRALRTQLLVSPADSIWTEKNTAFYLWHTDSVEVTLEGSLRRKSVEQIAYDAVNQGWEIILSDLEEGLAREIELYLGKDNYFKINYGRVCVNPDGC